MDANLYVTVIIPLALPKAYTYAVPNELSSGIKIGVRVEVPIKRKLYAGVVFAIGKNIESDYTVKDVVSVLDTIPIISEKQIKFWNWIADYYMCTLGEVMHAALPSGLKLESETKVIVSDSFEGDFTNLSDDEYLVAEALSIRQELSIQEISEILNRKTIYPIIRSLLDFGILEIYEKLNHKYKIKKVRAIKLADEYQDETILTTFIDQKIRSENQEKVLLAYCTLDRSLSNLVPVSDIYELTGANSTHIKALEKKGLIIVEEIESSRLTIYGETEEEVPPLSEEQANALKLIAENSKAKKPSLIHGITGSGKTRIYIEMISEALKENKQSLYLLPEIALTTQIVERIENYFGSEIVVYHSRLNNAERVEIWKAVLAGKKVVLGARSSLFLPFQNLGLVIVDEEHDSSYKQQNPNPRYNGRDLAVLLAAQHGAQIVLGSATPSLESYTNAMTKKYGLVELKERYGESILPKIEIVDLKQEKRVGILKNSSLSRKLQSEIQNSLDNNKQVIIFQNRRGFAPVLQCNDCGWRSECKNCDVTLTLHRYFDELRCHYCGYRTRNAKKCPDCQSDNLFELGQGTERIEEDLQLKFPDARISRMDHDTTKSKSAFEKIISDFSRGRSDILVGTQMVTKGFDFDHLGLVGIINADSLTRFPDFRAGERAFQQMTQVAGRAGRRGEQGLVIVQAFSPEHPTILETISNDYINFFKREMKERKEFYFPPFYKMIRLEFKHVKHEVLALGAKYFAEELQKEFTFRIKGPFIPSVARVKNKYIQFVNIKMEIDQKMIYAIKERILEVKEKMRSIDGIKGVRVNIDVDPY